MLEPAFFISLRWLSAGTFVLGCGLTVGCLLACVYLLLRREWKEAVRYLGFGLLAVGLVLGSYYADLKIVWEYYAYYDRTAQYFGYFFPGLFGLFFLPEPLRRAKLRLRMRRSRYGRRPVEPVENKSSTRVSSLPSRRKS